MYNRYKTILDPARNSPKICCHLFQKSVLKLIIWVLHIFLCITISQKIDKNGIKYPYGKKISTLFNNAYQKMLTFLPGELGAGSLNYIGAGPARPNDQKWVCRNVQNRETEMKWVKMRQENGDPKTILVEQVNLNWRNQERPFPFLKYWRKKKKKRKEKKRKEKKKKRIKKKKKKRKEKNHNLMR